MKIVWSMASGCGHLIKSRQWAAKIESVVAAADKESDSMHGGGVGLIYLEGVFYRDPLNRAIGEEMRTNRKLPFIRQLCRRW